MKISCSKNDLLNGVQTVYKAVPSKTTMTILECILIEAAGGDIKLTANDTELGIETYIKGNVNEEGSICIDARMFQEIVRKLPDNEVSIETEDNTQALIICEKAKFNISCRSSEEFCYLPDLEKVNPLIISQYSLKEVVRQTIFSIAPESEPNKMMTGELFEIKGNDLRVAALDGHRLSIRNIELRNEYEDKRVIVPGKTLNEVIKIISGDTDKDINIYFTKNHIIFEFDRTTVVSRLLEGKYFNIDQMLTSDYETKFNINKKVFTECIERALLLVKEGDKKPLSIDVTDENIAVSISSAQGSMEEDIDINKTGKDVKMGFNPKFIVDALRVIDEENVDFYIVNAKAPCFIRDDEKKYIYLILPVNTR
ncbi:MAG: DNA polymerase III subunit beta [Lachnospiraceae bacterium]|nr:DNA polymerase III subunit beta [Lachnospiraceae bacterium]